eukprot:m51a1_g14348 hypothetical protein (317) ;mRNA; f:177446-181423
MGYDTNVCGILTLSVLPTARDPAAVLRAVEHAIEALQSNWLCTNVDAPDGDWDAILCEFGGTEQQEQRVVVLDSRAPPFMQPSPCCTVTTNGSGRSLSLRMWSTRARLLWAWLQYVISRVLEPLGVVANGHLVYKGDGKLDRGRVVVRNNVVTCLGPQLPEAVLWAVFELVGWQARVLQALLKAGAVPSAESQQTGERPCCTGPCWPAFLFAVVAEPTGASAGKALHSTVAPTANDANRTATCPLDCTIENGHKAATDVLSSDTVDPAGAAVTPRSSAACGRCLPLERKNCCSAEENYQTAELVRREETATPLLIG